MQVEIRKTSRWHEIAVQRADGVALALRSPDRKFSPPHDLVHLVVERALGLDGGFWGCVAKGAKFPGMEVTAGRQKPQAEARSQTLIKENKTKLNETEVFVGVFQEALLEDGGEAMARRNERLRLALAARGRKLTPEAVATIWDDLFDMRRRWEALAEGESLTVDWPEKRRR